MATLNNMWAKKSAYQEEEERKEMARAYTFENRSAMRRHPYQHNAPAPAKEKPPVYRDIGFYLEDIPRGKTVTLPVEIRYGHVFGDLFPESFVFSGSRDLWLLPDSNCSRQALIETPLPLDTFRHGAPHRVSWPTMRLAYSPRLELVIENRGRARNEAKGTFVARLTCLVKEDSYA